MSNESQEPRDCPTYSGSVDMYLPGDSEAYLGWNESLTIHFTESCSLIFDLPDAVQTLSGESLPDGQTRCAFSTPWGPGFAQEGYACREIKVTTGPPDNDVCPSKSSQSTRSGHIIHVGSSGKRNLQEAVRKPKPMSLPHDPDVKIDPLTETLVLGFTEACKFECSAGDVNLFEEDVTHKGLPKGDCFDAGGNYGPATAQTNDYTIHFTTHPGCPTDLSEPVILGSHRIIVGSGGPIILLEALGQLFLSDRAALRSWPETRRVLGAVFDAEKRIHSEAATEFLDNLISAGDKLYEASDRG